MNVISFVVNVFLGLWLVPYLVEHVGVAAYGLIPLAMIFTEYISIITVSINGSISRFITIDIQNSNWVGANKTFNTAFFALTALILIQIPILGYVTYNLSELLNIPPFLLKDAFYLFAFTFVGYLFSLFSAIFNTSMYANNRLDLTRTIDIGRVLIRVITIVLLFIIFQPSLKFVGIANLLGGIFTLIVSLTYWKKLTPNLFINIAKFDKDIFKKITSMGGWLTINMIGYLLFLKIDILIVNKFLGAEAGGEYAAVLQWNLLIRTVAGVLSGVIGPMILISYAKKEMGKVINFSELGVKYLSIFIGLITGILCGIAAPLLGLWLGDGFSELSYLLIVMLCTLSINLGILPLISINTALNKVKIPGILSLLMGILNLILAILFMTIFNLGFFGVALAGAIALTLKNGLFSPWYAAKVLDINKLTFFKPLRGGIIIFFISFIITVLIAENFQILDWLSLFTVGLTTSIICLFLIWFMIFKQEDKNMLIGFIPNPIAKYCKK